jgi:hypothetical protein
MNLKIIQKARVLNEKGKKKSPRETSCEVQHREAD